MVAYKQRVIDMDKLTMAHEYMVSWLKSGNAELDSAEELALFFFDMAEIMQAEADKRKVSGIPDVLRGANGEIVAVKVCEEEWQLDWSQAPDWANWWCLSVIHGAMWFSREPTCAKVTWVIFNDVKFCAASFDEAPSFGYTGNWKDSLRKRP